MGGIDYFFSKCSRSGEFCSFFVRRSLFVVFQFETSELLLARCSPLKGATKATLIETLRFAQGETQCIFQMSQFSIFPACCGQAFSIQG
jgi:hypothetical protein